MTTTKGNFSKAPSDALATANAQNYVAVHVEQGVPVLDRDLNLLGDLITAALQRALSLHVGTGVPGTSDFQITANGASDLNISAGSCIVNGIDVTLAASTSYQAQVAPSSAKYVANTLAAQYASPTLLALTVPASGTRTDTVYLDVWQTEVDDVTAPSDPALGNPTDIGVRTSTRIQTLFVVRVAEPPATVPSPPPAGHWYYVLAQLSRTGAAVPLVKDLRQTSLSMPVLDARLRVLESLLQPTITSFSPEHVVAGQSNPLKIIGKNFLVGTAQVLLGTVPAVIDWTQTTDTLLWVVVPYTANVGSQTMVVPLTISNGASSAIAASPLAIDPATPLAFVPATPPGSQLSVTHGVAGSTLVLNGTNFVGVNRVTFNGALPVTTTPTIVTATAVTLTVPATLPAGNKSTLTVSISGVPGLTATSTDQFLIDSSIPVAPAPTFASPNSQFNPTTQSIGFSVKLNGHNFGTDSTTTKVAFNGTNAAPVPATIVSITPGTGGAYDVITVTVPAGLTVAPAPNNKALVTVTVNGQSVQSTDALTIA